MKTRTLKRKTALRSLCGAGLLALASCGGSALTGSAEPYPADTCLVTDNKLGSMGDPVSKVYQGKEVKFCCQPCVAKFEANPDKYLQKLAAM
ncbi:YHS domain-containing protein [Roseibacillus ishigakijimensis]|uniref:YHS domain-containing protein n=1 Tax=Roseibacillus ishigakijimensis TaxID=454146 RepID=A0A934VLS0_9BACT|nr:YHS domain-containing protein [Roseibacillus ishigakijimensis]MBK1833537.1 YHS domain-containing protein [Roseibacillus ishigakijimensis]